MKYTIDDDNRSEIQQNHDIWMSDRDRRKGAKKMPSTALLSGQPAVDGTPTFSITAVVTAFLKDVIGCGVIPWIR